MMGGGASDLATLDYDHAGSLQGGRGGDLEVTSMTLACVWLGIRPRETDDDIA